MIHVDWNQHYRAIRLCRPEQRNALSLALLSELQSALTVDAINDVPTVVISGSNGIFSAGADFFDLTGTTKDIQMDDAIAAVVAAIAAVRVPVIAWVDGACIGGAVDIMLACDIRVASERAWFQVPATRLGLLYNPNAVARMHEQLPRDTLTRLLEQGQRFAASQALAAGLVTHASPQDGDRASSTSDDQRAGQNVDTAVAATRALLDALNAGTFDAVEWQQRRYQLLDSPERASAIDAARNNAKG